MTGKEEMFKQKALKKKQDPGWRVFEAGQTRPISWCPPNATCGTANPHGPSGVPPRQVDERWRQQESRSGCKGQEAKHRFVNCERRFRCAPRLGQGQTSINWQESLLMMARKLVDCAFKFPPSTQPHRSGLYESPQDVCALATILL